MFTSNYRKQVFAHSDPLFKAIGFLKVEDIVVINKIIFIYYIIGYILNI